MANVVCTVIRIQSALFYKKHHFKFEIENLDKNGFSSIPRQTENQFSKITKAGSFCFILSGNNHFKNFRTDNRFILVITNLVRSGPSFVFQVCRP